ncbi:hypothetical protein MMC25_004352 [Agyrium rufum]|nr:hypothetical protein [Agyrium rufum]
MIPLKLLPYPDYFANAEDYTTSLLHFVSSSERFETVCGGVHILDFLTQESDLYRNVLPRDWREWISGHEIDDLLDLLLRENLDQFTPSRKELNIVGDDGTLGERVYQPFSWRGNPPLPDTLLEYVVIVRRHTLIRDFTKSNGEKAQPVARRVSVGMNEKKVHEVEKFAAFLSELSLEIEAEGKGRITHFVDFGSGQNYLGRALASPPYDKQVVAIESQQSNIEGAKRMDINANLAERLRILRNKKAYRNGVSSENVDRETTEVGSCLDGHCNQTKTGIETDLDDKPIFRQDTKLSVRNQERRKILPNSKIHYVEHAIEDGDLADVLDHISTEQLQPHASDHLSQASGASQTESSRLSCMVISLHSCGNLVHHGLRSLVRTPAVNAVAMVGCCYNLLTECLGPTTFKLPELRRPNERLERTSMACDPHGFPMSERLATYAHQRGHQQPGIRLNITARSMAVQAPQNWTATSCESFFKRHFYRALLQRVLLERGVLPQTQTEPESAHLAGGSSRAGHALIVGSLRKSCYGSFVAYVRGAIAKLAGDATYGGPVKQYMMEMTDEEIQSYETRFASRKKDLSAIWSLMAFSAGVTESLIVVDRWQFLREQECVQRAWVQTVFESSISPRNFVVVGLKY